MSGRDGHDYDDIVVVGGGCYGGYYVTQLIKARAAGALTFQRIVVVDHNPHCALAQRGLDPRLVHVEVVDWPTYFDWYLAEATPESRDAIVPSPLMPHLMYQWLFRRAQTRWPGRVVETRLLPADLNVPWRQTAPDGTQYASYATWTCPINCIEPRRCPHTRGERDWSMPDAGAELVRRVTEREGAGEGAHERALQGPVIFHCTHRAYGVGMFDTRDVVAGDAVIQAAGAGGSADVLVGTVSHCHGAFNVLHVGM